jgi:hypothetical protein
MPPDAEPRRRLRGWTRLRAGSSWLAGITAVALGLRVWNLLELRANDPFFADPSVDERMYHEWARAIARGDGFGDQVFLNGPAYPAFLALLYRVFGPSLLAAKAVQSVLGVVDCVLAWALGRRLLARASGSARPPSSRSTSSRSSTQHPAAEGAGTLLLAMLWLCVRAQESAQPARWAAGACTGLAALARPTALLSRRP